MWNKVQWSKTVQYFSVWNWPPNNKTVSSVLLVLAEITVAEVHYKSLELKFALKLFLKECPEVLVLYTN